MTAVTTKQHVTIDRLDIMARLRTETRPDHDAAEAIDFSKAILEERLPLEAYAGQIQAYLVVHEALEEALSASTHPAVQAVWNDELRRVDNLKKDLAVVEANQPGNAAHMNAAKAFADDIRALAATQPVGLLGCWYVLQGSTLGATILAKHIANMYGFDQDNGLSYYLPFGKDVMAQWKLFKERMIAMETMLDEAQCDFIVEQARQAFKGVANILTPLSETQAA